MLGSNALIACRSTAIGAVPQLYFRRNSHSRPTLDLQSYRKLTLNVLAQGRAAIRASPATLC